MPTLHDLIEVTGFPQFTTLQASNGDILDVHDNVFWNGSGDIDEGNDLTIDGTVYNIDQIYELDGNMTMVTSGGPVVFEPSSESDLEVMLLEVSNGGTTRYFLLPNDSFGDLEDIESISFGAIGNVSGSDASITAGTNNSTSVVCFCADTLIEITNGNWTRVIDLRVGDAVMTADRGAQKIRWIGARNLTREALTNQVKLRPIRIRASALGDGIPFADLMVSRQHRILVQSPIVRRMVGAEQVLVPAIDLTVLDGIGRCDSCDPVTYCHFLFERHEIVSANGAATESLFTGPMAMQALPPAARSEILGLFPNLATLDYAGPPARPMIKGPKGRRLAMRHHKNGRELQGVPA